MKQSAGFIASAVCLTVIFYLLSYYLLPGPAPDGSMVALFAGVALLITWAFTALRRRGKGADSKSTDLKQKLVILLLAGVAALNGCNAAPRSTSESTAAPATDKANAPGDRITGTVVLIEGKHEEAGYGLYSYALLTHAPKGTEVAQYKAFLKALSALPKASDVAKYVPLSRINVTYLLLTSSPEGWEQMSEDARVDFMIDHYDYARGTVLASSLGTKVGTGPVIVSVLKPINPAEHPRPVLVQDMTKAQPSLMTAYVTNFVTQASQDQFWEQSALRTLALSLRNALETAAMALNVSKTAVSDWVKFVGSK